MISDIQPKIKKLSTLVTLIDSFRTQNKKIVLSYGIFDLIHPGHIRHLRLAKSYGDVLITALIGDAFVKKGPGRPVFKSQLRAEQLAALEAVDFVTVIDSPDLVSVIQKLKPHILVKGSDEKDDGSDEKKAVQSLGGKVMYTDNGITFSSTQLINRYLDFYPPKTKSYLDQFKQKYPAEYITDNLKKLSSQKIMIIGDAIIDQYYYCLPLGKSSKEPVMVHQYISHESFAGGVLATSNHAASLVGQITMVTMLGKKHSFKNFITQKLRGAVKPVFFYDPGISTIIKRRFVDFNTNQKQFQISYLRDDYVMPENVEKSLYAYLSEELPKYDMVIVNDFGHGLLSSRIVHLIAKKAKYIALNVQANSANFGYNVITKYPRADYVCIDNQEIRLATHDKISDLEILMKNIFRKLKCSAMMVTRGPHGSIFYSTKSGLVSAPALSNKIVDRVGAGDALFAITSPCVYGGMPADLVTFMGNVAGALKVQVVGNKRQIEYGELEGFIGRLLQ